MVDCFKKEDDYKVLTDSTPKGIFQDILQHEPDVFAEVETFDKFACYFKGYQENRKNIYSAEAQQTSAAFRAVNENFVKFTFVVRIFTDNISKYPDLLLDISERTAT